MSQNDIEFFTLSNELITDTNYVGQAKSYSLKDKNNFLFDFVGNISNLNMNGTGKAIFHNKSKGIYKGQFENNQICGQGELDLTTHKFIGNFVDGKIEGTGKILFADGAELSGTFTNGQLSGIVIAKFLNNQLQIYNFQSQQLNSEVIFYYGKLHDHYFGYRLLLHNNSVLFAHYSCNSQDVNHGVLIAPSFEMSQSIFKLIKANTSQVQQLNSENLLESLCEISTFLVKYTKIYNINNGQVLSLKKQNCTIKVEQNFRKMFAIRKNFYYYFLQSKNTRLIFNKGNKYIGIIDGHYIKQGKYISYNGIKSKYSNYLIYFPNKKLVSSIDMTKSYLSCHKFRKIYINNTKQFIEYSKNYINNKLCQFNARIQWKNRNIYVGQIQNDIPCKKGLFFSNNCKQICYFRKSLCKDTGVIYYNNYITGKQKLEQYYLKLQNNFYFQNNYGSARVSWHNGSKYKGPVAEYVSCALGKYITACGAKCIVISCEVYLIKQGRIYNLCVKSGCVSVAHQFCIKFNTVREYKNSKSNHYNCQGTIRYPNGNIFQGAIYNLYPKDLELSQLRNINGTKVDTNGQYLLCEKNKYRLAKQEDKNRLFVLHCEMGEVCEVDK